MFSRRTKDKVGIESRRYRREKVTSTGLGCIHLLTFALGALTVSEGACSEENATYGAHRFLVEGEERAGELSKLLKRT